jgi:tRNA threonylcarbamoyladenosine biosynthesis protein TsaB
VSTTTTSIVAIETATETVGVAVRTAEGVEAEFALTGRRRHVESLTPALEHLLSQVGLGVGDIGTVAVDIGPGLFTGLRVGVSAAKGLAQALGIGVVGVSSLDVLVEAAQRTGHEGLVLAMVDARRGEVFATLREVGRAGLGPEVMATGLFAPEALAAELSGLGGRAVLAVGDGAARYTDVFGAVAGVTPIGDSLLYPPPLVLLTVASVRLGQGEPPVDPAHVVPLYMRDADAISNFKQITPA